MNKNWSKIGLVFFFVIALFGSLMRIVPFSNILVDYKHILHAHSHVAFQGWIYISLFLFITNFYIDTDLLKKGKYKLQLSATILAVIGIMISFLIQGYALFSIAFSSIFQLLNYWFIFRFFKDVKKSSKAKPHFFSIRFIKVSMVLMLISTLGPWAVGILSAKGLAGSEYFDSALYFFLHFQYNGWFTFATLGLFFGWLESIHIKFNLKYANQFFIFSSLSIVPAYALSLLGMSFANYFKLPAYIGASLQLIGLFYFIKLLVSSKKPLKNKLNSWSYLFLIISFLSFFLKNFLQASSSLPFLETLAFNNKFLIIGYIHLVMIGFLSFLLLSLLFQLKWLNLQSTLAKIGAGLLLSGFLSSEFVLVLLGLIPSLFLQKLMAFLSFAMALGIGLILIKQIRGSKNALDSDI